MVQRGYIVAATDYPGLGAPETHPYLVGESEARAVLDSVRAARELTGAPARFAVWGHSQGGQAALFTGMLAKSYAPELDLVGAAAAAPATELGTLLADDIDTNGGRNLTAMTLWSWSRIFNAPIDRVVDPSAMSVVDRLAGECIESIYDILRRRGPTRLLTQSFLSEKDFYRTEPWRALMTKNTPGALPPHIPSVSSARRRRRVGPAASHARLHEAAVRCWKQGPVVFHADREPWVRGAQQRFSGRAVDGGSICGDWSA